jgi:PAS domain S-box-containing protein/putative nucleotidyltransferase with HDIG domain
VAVPLRTLIIDDSEDDGVLVIHELRRGGYDPTSERIETAEAMSKALDKQAWDIVICDYVMPSFSGLAALKLLQEKDIDIPFIIVSGKIGEDVAVEAMKAGAHDYVMKSNLSRLVPAVKRELDDVVVRRERRRAEDRLRYQVEFEKLISGISTHFINCGEHEIDRTINKSLKELGEFVGADRSYIFQFADHESKMKNTHRWCCQGIEKQAGNRMDLAADNLPWWMAKLRKFENIQIAKLEDLPPEAAMEKECLKSLSIRSLLVVPMVYNKKLVGFLGFHTVRRQKTWAEDYISLLNILGEIFANALERKRTEEALRDSEEKYRSIFESFYDVYFRTDMDGRITIISPSIMYRTGYSPDEFIGQSAGIIYLHPRDSVMVRKELLQRGIIDGRELQVRAKNGTVMDVSLTARLVLGKNGIPVAMEGILHDITERKRAEESLKMSLEKLERAVEGTIEALARMAELRDPYTAGHQRRVSRLACAIAEEMGIEGQDMDGIRMAGAIHDLGKIYVPAEILSKSGGISELEFTIIKHHPQVAYDILSAIEFPWPLADIVVQHHERLDGSGYPNGTTGRNILLHARILAVADVVEAMASHRPYRPALGMDKAMEEIANNSGVLYDKDVVKACHRVIANGFQFD